MWISREKYDQMIETTNRMMTAMESAQKELKAAQDHAFLIDINRDGRALKFLFSRNGEIYTIETMSLLSDNMNEWKEKLLR